MTTALAAFTLAHVIISIVAILSGMEVMAGLLSSQRRDGWTIVFLATTIATSASGFGFPAAHILPSHIVGAVSLVVLALACLARYMFRLAGAWRRVYTIGATTALYLNVFVLVVQLFRRVPALNALAPRQTEPPFAIAQGVVLVLFIALGVAVTIRFRDQPPSARVVPPRATAG